MSALCVGGVISLETSIKGIELVRQRGGILVRHRPMKEHFLLVLENGKQCMCLDTF